jgi:hypothetical protein
MNNKQTSSSADIDCLPPNKRRLRERNAGFISTSVNEPSDNSPVESNTTTTTTTTTREIPTNSIKQFLEIRQQV